MSVSGSPISDPVRGPDGTPYGGCDRILSRRLRGSAQYPRPATCGGTSRKKNVGFSKVNCRIFPPSYRSAQESEEEPKDYHMTKKKTSNQVAMPDQRAMDGDNGSTVGAAGGSGAR